MILQQDRWATKGHHQLLNSLPSFPPPIGNSVETATVGTFWTFFQELNHDHDQKRKYGKHTDKFNRAKY